MEPFNNTYIVNQATPYAVVIKAEVGKYWPDMLNPIEVFAQIEQETCGSRRQCWNPKAELKTSREYGFGLGQVTIAYNSNGSERFNRFTELKNSYKPELAGWTWSDRYNSTYQIRSFILSNHSVYNRFGWAVTTKDQTAFTYSAYNGGVGGVMQDRNLCKKISGCDPNKWFGHVALNSTKSRIAKKGYGESFYDINRGYVTYVMEKRWPKYSNLWASVN